MPKQLTAQTATITTAAVEVKTLTVSGKQVTLAVFRQLREEPLIADDGTLNGVPWGYVNYHPDKCGGDSHWHFVWQRSEELLRSRVQKQASFDEWNSDDREFDSDDTGAYVEALVSEWLHGRRDDCPLDRENRSSAFSKWCKFKIAGLIVTADVSTCAVKAADARTHAIEARARADGYADKYPTSDYPQRAEKAEKLAQVALADLDAQIDSWRTSLDELAVNHEAAIAAEVGRRQRHRDVRKALADLPQLFIAV